MTLSDERLAEIRALSHVVAENADIYGAALADLLAEVDRLREELTTARCLHRAEQRRSADRLREARVQAEKLAEALDRYSSRNWLNYRAPLLCCRVCGRAQWFPWLTSDAEWGRSGLEGQVCLACFYEAFESGGDPLLVVGVSRDEHESRAFCAFGHTFAGSAPVPADALDKARELAHWCRAGQPSRSQVRELAEFVLAALTPPAAEPAVDWRAEAKFLMQMPLRYAIESYDDPPVRDRLLAQYQKVADALAAQGGAVFGGKGAEA